MKQRVVLEAMHAVANVYTNLSSHGRANSIPMKSICGELSGNISFSIFRSEHYMTGGSTLPIMICNIKKQAKESFNTY